MQNLFSPASDSSAALKLAVVATRQSQRALALEAGISEGRFSSIVNGWVKPSARERAELRRLLRVDDLTIDAAVSRGYEHRGRRGGDAA